jgi:hypothetical protein
MRTAAQIIKRHYGLSRLPSDQEVKAEIANIKRRKAAMSLDNRQEILAAGLQEYLK